jgi:deazaflavin-dependent oxidoreductase (nitroreductase family)
VPTLLLTTTGRKSKQPQQLPLIYGQDGARYVIIASKGGAPEHPGWYQNLVAEPRVELQVAADKFRARARTSESGERERLWKR